MLKNLVYISIFTFFVTSIWVGLSIYHNIKTSTISSDLSIQIVPIEDSFETSVIDILKKKQSIKVNLAETITYPSTTPEGEKISTPGGKLKTVSIANPSISPTPTASNSGSTNFNGF